jgi:hypothetical protein
MRLARRRARRRLAVVAVAWLCACRPALAQDPLADVLAFLLTNQAVPTGDFERDAEAARATSATMSRLLLVELSTLPISSASPGFVYRLNPSLGTPERASESFGPFFTERSLTTGAGRFTVGAAFTVRQFNRLDGQSLEDGTFVTSGNQFRDEAPPFDVETLALSLESRTFTLTGTLGVTDRVDVGVVLPFVSLSLEGQRLNTYRGTSVVQATADATATGVGDMGVRGKVRLLGTRGSGIGALVELRLPTGRREDLLGSGETSVLAALVGSAETGAVTVHATGGLTRGGLSDEWHYRGAFTVNASRYVTLVGELLGRRVDQAGRVMLRRAPHPSIVGVDTLRLLPDGTNTHTAVAVLGAKWNITRTLLLGANVSLPLTDAGLRPSRVLAVGVEYSK